MGAASNGTSSSDLVYLGQALADAPATSAPLNFSESCAPSDLIVFLVATEYNSGQTPQDNTLSISGASSLTKVVSPNTSYVSSASIYSTSGSNLGAGTSFTALFDAGTAAIARFSVNAYKIKGGATLIDSATVSALNGSGESVTVDFSSGYLLGIYYTGANVQHTWSGVTNYYEIPYIDASFSEGSYAYNDTPTNSSHSVSVSHASQTNSQGLQLCVVVYGTGGGDVWTDPDLANASYDSVSFSVATEESAPRDVTFKPDGAKMYVVGSGGDEVNEYDLSTAWDISTSSYLQNFSVSAQDTAPTGIFFKPDGTKIYILGSTGDDVNEYDLSTAWDISTASYVQNFSVSTEESIPDKVVFKPDGTKMYVIGYNGDEVNEYDLSAAWDVSTASYLQNFSVAAQDTVPRGLFFNPDGTKMYIAGQSGAAVHEYELSTAWDISTASYVQNFSVSAQDTAPQSVFFKSDGSKMYVVGLLSDTIYQYSTD